MGTGNSRARVEISQDQTEVEEEDFVNLSTSNFCPNTQAIVHCQLPIESTAIPKAKEYIGE